MSLGWSSTDFTSPFSATTKPAKGVPNVITMTNFSGIAGTRLLESVATEQHARYARVWKQRPALVAMGAFPTDNSTGVSAVWCRHQK